MLASPNLAESFVIYKKPALTYQEQAEYVRSSHRLCSFTLQPEFWRRSQCKKA